MRLSDFSLGERSDSLFALFYAGIPSGSKEEELIDLCEFLVVICIVSGIKLHEKIFLFDTFKLANLAS